MSYKFYSNNFDLIRLLAASQVVIVHGYEHLEITSYELLISIIKLFPGVPIFFVISGFLISASLERTHSLKSYIKNRILRIYPALWVCFLFSFLVVIAADVELDYSATELYFWLFSQLSFLQFYNPTFLRDFGVGVLNGSLWTIPIELQFYAILPLIYFFTRKLRLKKYVSIILLILFVVTGAFYTQLKFSVDNIYVKLLGVSIIPYLYIFLIGVLLQRNMENFSHLIIGKAPIYLALYLISVYFCYVNGYQYHGNYINPVSVILLALFTLSVAYTKPSISNALLKGNDFSYGIYIYHMIFINFLISAGIKSTLFSFWLMILSTCIAAGFSWFFVEKPILLLKKKYK